MSTGQILAIICPIALGYFAKIVIKLGVAVKAAKLGVQALLRDRMYEYYDKYHEEKKYAPKWAKENYDNMYKQYHSLGENGVMDTYHEEFMLLPEEPPTT